MSNIPSDTQEDFQQHDLHGHYGIASLAANTVTTGVYAPVAGEHTIATSTRIGSVIMSSAVTSATIQMYGTPSDTQSSSAEHFAMRAMTIESPPRLPRIVSIALPPLSPNVPIQIHAVITYRRSIPPIHWNTSYPPPTAVLAVANSGISTSRWSRDIAVVPPTVSSFTIRIRGVARPVVVFPLEAGLPIRIIDILRGVYNAMRTEALENGTGASNTPAYGANGQDSRRDLASDDAMAADAIRRHFQNRVWWNGLSQSLNEVDVWVLHLRGLSRGRFRG